MAPPVAPPKAPPVQAPPTQGSALRVGAAVLTVLLFLLVAFGRRYAAELGEWMEDLLR